jgi:transglutaminase-like putative cysteine protease
MMRLYTLVLWLLASVAHGQSSPTFAQIELTLHSEQALPLPSNIQFEVVVNKPSEYQTLLAGWEGVQVDNVSGNTLTLSLNEHYVANAPVINKHTQSSFVIDYDEPQVQSVLTQFKQANPVVTPALLGQSIEQYVSTYITEPSYIHNFAFASTVAKSKSGDCTEFAVLTAALARGLDVPARVVVGSVLVEVDKTLEAFGHAWNELYIENRWQRIDAALTNQQNARMFYLPSYVLDNEGPGYALALGKSMFTLPQRITDVRGRK